MARASFADRLRELRRTAGLTQQQLARRSGVSPRALSELELGDQSPSWEMVCRLADALHVTVAAFAGNGAESGTNGAGTRPTRKRLRALRQRAARTIRESVANLREQVTREDFAVCTYPVLKRINELLVELASADAEGNTREILRQLRNTLMNGGWNKYRDPCVRQTTVEILNELAEAVEVLPQQVDEAFDRLNSTGLNPVGVSLFAVANEDDAGEGQGVRAAGPHGTSATPGRPRDGAANRVASVFLVRAVIDRA
jgi:transcriptional regulator with XRE-family HTH domain